MHLIGVLGRTGFHQVFVIGIVGIVVDRGQGRLGKSNAVKLAGVKQFLGLVDRLDHGDDDFVKQLAVFVPVQGIFGEDLFRAFIVGGHGIGAGIPHFIRGQSTGAFHAQFIDHALGKRIQARIGGNGVKVRSGILAGIHDGIFVGSGNADCLKELAFIGQGSGFLGIGLGEGFGVLIVLFSALQRLKSHGGIGCFVLGIVEGPFETGQPVFSNHVALIFAVGVDPYHIVAKMEGPDYGFIIMLPGMSSKADQCAGIVVIDKAVKTVVQDVQFLGALGHLDKPIFHFVGRGLVIMIYFQLFRGREAEAADSQSDDQNQRQDLLHTISS